MAGLSELATQGTGGTRAGAAIRLVLGVVFILLTYTAIATITVVVPVVAFLLAGF